MNTPAVDAQESGMRSSQRTVALQSAALVGMQERATKLLEQGRQLYPLVLGESDLPTPRHIVEAGQRALADGYTRYPPGLGYPELREAIARKVQYENQFSIDSATQVFVTNGSGLGIYLALICMTDPGDEVMVSGPTYGPFLDAIELAGAKPVFARQYADSTGQLRWDPEILASVVSRRSKAIMINTPSAPTGTVMAAEELTMLGRFAIDHDLGIISDEVFEHLLFDDRQHLSIAALDSGFARRTVTVFSFSKSYAMTGWRLGYNVGPASLIAAMERASLAFGRPAAAFTQIAGIQALLGPQDFIPLMVRHYTQRRNLIDAELASLPNVGRVTPEGSFYYFLDFSAYGNDSREIAEELLERSGVILTPGTFYGPAGQGWLRLSFAGDEQTILSGLEQLRVALESWQ